MNVYSNSDIKYLPIVSAVVLVTAAAIAMTWPYTVAFAHTEAAKLIEQAPYSGAAEASSFYQLASILDAGNHASYVGLAQIQIATGQSSAALISLAYAGEGTAVLKLRLKTLMELRRYDEALNLADSLAKPGASNADIVLSGLAYALAGRARYIDALITRVDSPEAVQRLTRAKAGNVLLATELYTSGLPNSSRALAETQPDTFERDLLLGRIAYAQNTNNSLIAATDYLRAAALINPSNQSTRELLAKIYTARGLFAEGSTQESLAQKIRSGQP